MFYKKCDTCTNKTCIKTKKICASMDRYLKDHVEVSQQHKLAETSKQAMRIHGIELDEGCQE